MAKMEPIWSISKVRLIFADNFINPYLLTKLCINYTYTLICDHYHLIKEVWSSASSFGEVKLSQILPYLNAMLISYKKYQWDKAYNDSFMLLSDKLIRQIILKSIYDRSTYYAGYHLYSIEGHLKYTFSTPAERNYSSTAAYFGKGNSWSISTQIK